MANHKLYTYRFVPPDEFGIVAGVVRAISLQDATEKLKKAYKPEGIENIVPELLKIPRDSVEEIGRYIE